MTLCVVGGGVAGLSAAHYALKAPGVRRIVLIEAAERLGGWIDTVRWGLWRDLFDKKFKLALYYIIKDQLEEFEEYLQIYVFAECV